MSVLFLDDSILNDSTKWAQNKEIFKKSIDNYIETHYKKEDSASVYALFTPEQINILQWYYKGYSIEEYKELAGTVDLQIQARDAKIKQKIENLCKFMDIPKSDIANWEYDGLVDAGPDANFRCDFCPRPVRYAHYAVNKKTHECLRFGCNCAAEFFSIDGTRLNALKTVQANTLKDLKYIACVIEKDLKDDYHNYMCGYAGKVYLEEGIDGLRDMMTFSVEWDADKKRIVGDVANDAYNVRFGDNHNETRSLEWIKIHIVSCTNADLDTNMYDDLSRRNIVYVDNKDISDKQVNNSFYITYAIKCLEVGLPIPLSICQNINKITARVSKQHHPDYIKFVEELLMQRNLAKNSLLRTAFKDFIVNYLASRMSIMDRDPELYCWGIRGEKTYYNVVLNWETAITRLMTMKQIDDLVVNGTILEKEWQSCCRIPENLKTTFFNNGMRMTEFIKQAEELFLTDGEVVRDDKELLNGYSKYSLKGVDAKLSIDNSKLGFNVKDLNPNFRPTLSIFTPDSIPFGVGLGYLAYQNGFKKIIYRSIGYIQDFTKAVSTLKTDEDVIKFLCALKKNDDYGTRYNTYSYSSIIHPLPDWKRYSYKPLTNDEILKKIDDMELSSEYVEKVKGKYLSEIPQFISDCKVLYEVLEEILNNVSKISFHFKGKSDISNDFDEIVEKKQKNAFDYFIDYTDLLIAPRNDDSVKEYLNQGNILDICAFKITNKYAPMMRDIVSMYGEKYKAEEEEKLYDYFGIGYEREIVNVLDKFSDEQFLSYMGAIHAAEIHKDYMYNSQVIDRYYIGSIFDNARRVDRLLEPELLSLYKTHLMSYFEKFHAQIHELAETLNKWDENKVGYEEYLDFLNMDTQSVKDELESVLTISDFGRLVNNKLGVYRSDRHLVEAHRIEKQLAPLWKYKPMLTNYEELRKTLEDFYEEYQEVYRTEYLKKDEEKRERKYAVQNLQEVLGEHIKFFEVDLDLARRQGYYNTGRGRTRTDAAVRRAVAFRKVKFEQGNDVVRKFIGELEKYSANTLSEDVPKYIAAAKKQLEDGVLVEKKYSEALRAETLNQKLAYNHFDITYKLLKDFENIDLDSMSLEDIKKSYELLKNYYILRSTFDNLFELVQKYGNITFDVQEEMSKLPTEEYKSAKMVYMSYSDEADSTGYTGVQKARLVIDHNDFNTLDNHWKDVINTVTRSGRCSPRQLVYVNQAFEKLGLGKPDTVQGVDNTLKTSDTEQKDSVDTTSVNSLSSNDELIDLALQLQAHSDYKTLPTWMCGIINTVASYKKKGNTVSPKQGKFILQAKDKLGL